MYVIAVSERYIYIFIYRQKWGFNQQTWGLVVDIYIYTEREIDRQSDK